MRRSGTIRVEGILPRGIPGDLRALTHLAGGVGPGNLDEHLLPLEAPRRDDGERRHPGRPASTPLMDSWNRPLCIQ